MVGIPYAHAIINKELQLVRVCPICKQQFPESTDIEGEQTTQNYAFHYQAEHGAMIEWAYTYRTGAFYVKGTVTATRALGAIEQIKRKHGAKVNIVELESIPD